MIMEWSQSKVYIMRQGHSYCYKCGPSKIAVLFLTETQLSIVFIIVQIADRNLERKKASERLSRQQSLCGPLLFLSQQNRRSNIFPSQFSISAWLLISSSHRGICSLRPFLVNLTRVLALLITSCCGPFTFLFQLLSHLPITKHVHG